MGLSFVGQPPFSFHAVILNGSIGFASIDAATIKFSSILELNFFIAN